MMNKTPPNLKLDLAIGVKVTDYTYKQNCLEQELEQRNKNLMNNLIQVGVKYGGEDVPGSPFEMSSNADTTDVIGDSSGIVLIIIQL